MNENPNQSTKKIAFTDSEKSSNKSYYFNTGEWINHFTYLVFENNNQVAVFNRHCFEANTEWIID